MVTVAMKPRSPRNSVVGIHPGRLTQARTRTRTRSQKQEGRLPQPPCPPDYDLAAHPNILGRLESLPRSKCQNESNYGAIDLRQVVFDEPFWE